MSFGPWQMLLDFCWMSLLLYGATFLRAKVKTIQNLFIPASIIAGFIGLIVGPNVLSVFPFSGQIFKYPWLLVVVLFASFPFSSPPVKSAKEVFKRAGSLLCFNLGAEIGLFAFSLLGGATIFALAFPEVRSAFPLLMPSGFVGGHGYASAIGGSLENQYAFEGAQTIAYTFATIGLFSAILMGIPLIKWASKKGLTRFISDVSELPKEAKTGLIPSGKRKSMGEETISPSSLDPLSFHILLVLMAAMAGHYASKYMGILTANLFERSFTLPDMAAAMICGLIIKKAINTLKLGEKYIDRNVVTRIGSTTTDYLVAFGVASIKISIVMDNIKPILFMCMIGYFLVLTYLFFFAPRMNPSFWFERGIFTFGWSTGVVAMGITLLRVVDPKFESGTLEDFGLAYTIIAPVELVLISFIPMTVGLGYIWHTIVALLGLFLVLVAMSVGFKFWSNSYPFWDIREAEREILEGIN